MSKFFVPKNFTASIKSIIETVDENFLNPLGLK